MSIFHELSSTTPVDDIVTQRDDAVFRDVVNGSGEFVVRMSSGSYLFIRRNCRRVLLGFQTSEHSDFHDRLSRDLLSSKRKLIVEVTAVSAPLACNLTGSSRHTQDFYAITRTETHDPLPP